MVFVCFLCFFLYLLAVFEFKVILIIGKIAVYFSLLRDYEIIKRSSPLSSVNTSNSYMHIYINFCWYGGGGFCGFDFWHKLEGSWECSRSRTIHICSACVMAACGSSKLPLSSCWFMTLAARAPQCSTSSINLR